MNKAKEKSIQKKFCEMFAEGKYSNKEICIKLKISDSRIYYMRDTQKDFAIEWDKANEIRKAVIKEKKDEENAESNEDKEKAEKLEKEVKIALQSRNGCKLKPKDLDTLKTMIDIIIKKKGRYFGLGVIDTSAITDMTRLFYKRDFYGDINDWNVSNVTTATEMFAFSSFNQPLNKWDVSKLENGSKMFMGGKFNQDISMWNPCNLKNGYAMFFDNAHFRQDLSLWNPDKLENCVIMFFQSGCEQIRPLDADLKPSWYYEKMKSNL